MLTDLLHLFAASFPPHLFHLHVTALYLCPGPLFSLTFSSHLFLSPFPTRYEPMTVTPGSHLHSLQTALEVKKIGKAIETHEKLYMYQVSKVSNFEVAP